MNGSDIEDKDRVEALKYIISTHLSGDAYLTLCWALDMEPRVEESRVNYQALHPFARRED